ncbi:MAG: SRPBCC domain-containing protein [Stenotrophobium sp.]
MTFIIEKTLDIDAPAELVWEVITDLKRYPEWNPFMRECSTTFKPGAPIDMKVQLMAKPQPQREWVLEYVEGKRFAYNMKPVPGGTLSSFRSHEVEALPGGRTRYRSYFYLKGWLMPVVRGLLGARLEKGFEGMTQGIKLRAEKFRAERQRAA